MQKKSTETSIIRRGLSKHTNPSKAFQDMSAILEISKAMMAEKDLDKLLGLIVLKATEVLEAERASIFLIDYDTNELWSRVAMGSEISEIRFPADKGIAGYAAQKREVINIKDAYADNRFNPEVDKKTGYRTRTILCAPLITHKNETIGVIQILNKKLGVFDEYDETLVMAFSAQAAVAIENAQLYQDQELTLKSFLKAMASAIDARDPTTAGHSERIARYAINIGKVIGFSEPELKLLDYAAALHDVGKIGVPDAILLKPDKLTPEEFAKMKQHAVKTKEILEQMFFGRELREIPHIASSHHEKIDGSGYPDGLKGDSISKAAKVLAIADVYDALVAQDRPYKKAMTHEQAMAILNEGRGAKFDAGILDLFEKQQLYKIERRKMGRFNIAIPVEYAILAPMPVATPASSQTVNISGLGALVTSVRLLSIGSIIKLKFAVAEKHYEIKAKVVRGEKKFAHKINHLGVVFTEMNEQQQNELAGLLKPQTLPDAPR